MLAVALCLASAASAGAAAPRWSQPRTVALSGTQVHAGIDDRGKVSVVWHEREGAGRVFGAVKEPGSPVFSAPFSLGWSDGPSRLVVTPGGEVVLMLYSSPCGSPSSCGLAWHMGLGTDLRRLSPQKPIAPGATGPSLGSAPNGRLMMAWPDSAGVIWQAERLPGAPRFEAPVRVDAEGHGRFPGSFPSVAVNARGDAAIA